LSTRPARVRASGAWYRSAVQVSIGFAIHTGWAAAVAVGGTRPDILARRKIDLADQAPGARFVYHAAARDPARAIRLIEDARRVAVERATSALRELVAELGDHTIVVALSPPKRVLPPLEKILQAHPLIHSAEGELFRGALAEAAEGLRLPVRVVRAGTIPNLGKMPPPWGKDQKDAAALAWAALAESAR
jgi:sugar phosphate isomerase/epimerase